MRGLQACHDRDRNPKAPGGERRYAGLGLYYFESAAPAGKRATRGKTTKTKTGLVVRATLLPGSYPTGVKISDSKMAEVCLRRHRVLPTWNYTLVPAQPKCELILAAMLRPIFSALRCAPAT